MSGVRAVWFTGPRQAELRDEALPPLGPGDLLVRAERSAISHGTEMLVYRGQVPPGASLARVLLPSASQSAIAVTVARDEHGDWDGSDEVTMWFEPSTGRLLRTDVASAAPSGEVAIRWLGLLHTGIFGGWPLKLLWAAGGLGLAALFVTGYVMWWSAGRVSRFSARRRMRHLRPQT